MDIVEQLRGEQKQQQDDYGRGLAVLDDAADEIARLRDENARLREDQGECDALRSKLTDILTRTANALKGEPGELQVHSWHDLPEWADRLRDERTALQLELNACAAALPGPYYMDPPDGGSVTVAEQVARMAKDAARYRWLKSMAFEQDDTYIVFPEISAWDYQPGPQLNEKFPTLDAAIDATMQKGE